MELLTLHLLDFLLEDENKSVYPTYMQTERPDIVATSLLEGKIAIVVDTTPFVLIIPAFFIDFINPGTDNYNKGKNINFIKILRISAFFNINDGSINIYRSYEL